MDLQLLEAVEEGNAATCEAVCHVEELIRQALADLHAASVSQKVMSHSISATIERKCNTPFDKVAGSGNYVNKLS